MIEVPVLFGHPGNPQQFERYYADKHLPIAAKMRRVGRRALTRFESGADGSKLAF